MILLSFRPLTYKSKRTNLYFFEELGTGKNLMYEDIWDGTSLKHYSIWTDSREKNFLLFLIQSTMKTSETRITINDSADIPRKLAAFLVG